MSALLNKDDAENGTAKTFHRLKCLGITPNKRRSRPFWKRPSGECNGCLVVTDDVMTRERAETVIILARHRIGQEEAKIANPRGRPTETIRSAEGFSSTTERHASYGKADRLKKLAAIKKDELLGLVKTLHEKGREATQTAVLKLANASMTQQRRAESRALAPGAFP